MKRGEKKKVEEAKVGPKLFTSSLDMLNYFHEFVRTWPLNYNVNKVRRSRKLFLFFLPSFPPSLPLSVSICICVGECGLYVDCLCDRQTVMEISTLPLERKSIYFSFP